MARNYFPGTEIWLGGIYASLMPDHAERLGVDKLHTGIWPELESLLPDYSIVPKWKNASILFTHRGCINSCPFCAVPALEGKPYRYCDDISIRHLIHPDHKKVILWDNNILGEPHWKFVVEEIKELGLEVDFNQGLDARLFTEEVAEAFRGLKMQIIRLAYDYPAMRKHVKKAIELLKYIGFPSRKIVSYVMFNFKDTPEQLFERVRDLVSWGTAAYPMRFQPLNALDKDTYLAPKWTDEELDLVAKARRVFGKGGSFPPYEGLVKKFIDAKNFEEAFSVWDKSKAPGSFANETTPKTIVFRNHTIRVQKSHNVKPKRNDKLLYKYFAANAKALGGKHALLVSNKGRTKRVSLLGIYRNIDGEKEIKMDKNERIVSVLTEYKNEDLLCIVTRRGRLGAFIATSVGAKNIEAPLSRRLETYQGDEVLSAFCAKTKRVILLVTKSGWARIIPANELYVYRASGRGTIVEFPGKRLKDIQFATSVNGNRFSVNLTTNKKRRIKKTLDLNEEQLDVFRLVHVKRGESVDSVRVKE
ncbi:hypothetical protein ACFL7E_02180 [Thermodesulfobacteriota bacterium]